MQLSLYADALIIIVISLLLKKKRLHAAEYIYVFYILTFLYASFISIIVDNLELWKVNEKPIPFALFRLSELLLFPLLGVWYVELFHSKSIKLYKVFITVTCLIFPVLLEQWLIYIDIIEYKHWYPYFTILTWVGFLTVSLLVQHTVRKQLIKEGVVHNASAS